MTDRPTPPLDPLRQALEKTAPASEFSAEGTRRELEQTVAGQEPPVTPGRHLEKTGTDKVLPPDDDTHGPVDLGITTVRCPDILDSGEAPGPRYAVERELGRGGAAMVYAVQDRSLGRTIALKMLRSRRPASPGATQRFVHEARVTAMLEHPNIVPVYDIGVTAEHRVFFLMKNVTGTTVGDAIRAEENGRQPPEDYGTIEGKLRIVHKVCDALAYAHHRGFVHQDIKPDNIMLGGFGEVLVLDWGCALEKQEQEPLRTVGFGTPAYMSPEQARQEIADERSDIYCLGATLYHMLTRHLPTWAEDPEAFWELKRKGELTSLPTEVEAAIPGPLLAVVRKTMAPDRASRYQGVAEFRAALLEYQRHDESAALAQSAAAAVAGARASGDYGLYASATARLEHALEMWPENAQAQAGLVEARRRYALCALERDDLALAASIVGDTPQLVDIRARIEAERGRRRIRQRRGQRVLLAAAALGALVVALTAYYAVHYFRYFGKWQLIHRQDFTRRDADVSGMILTGTASDPEVPVPRPGPGGLLLPATRTLWLDNVREAGDVRMEVTVRWPEKVDGMELHINARRQSQPAYWHCPAGYSAQVGGWSGTVNLVSRNEQPQAPNSGNSVGADFRPDRVYRLCFQRVGEELSLYVDGRRVFRTREPLPIAGDGLDMAAVRGWADVELRSVSIWRMGSPAKASPLIAGDVLVRRGHPADAIREYARLAADHAGGPIAEQALARAYLLAGTLSDPESDSARVRARRTMEQRHRHSSYWPLLMQADCERAWSAGRHEEALRLAAEALDRDRTSRIALRLLAASPGDLPPDIGPRLLTLVARTSDVRALRLVWLGLKDLAPLKGMRLISIEFSDNAVADLSPLKGMPLRTLMAERNHLVSLEPLTGMPLEVLHAPGNRIADLAPLAGTPLRRLNVDDNVVRSLDPIWGMRLEVLRIGRCGLTSLEPLRGMPLQELYCGANRLTDLSPLAGMPLTVLHCEWNDISTLEPLSGASLRELHCSYNPIRDLSPLRDVPLVDLRVDCLPVSDLSPLRGMALRRLDCMFAGVSSAEPLAGMPLQRLDLTGNRIADLGPLAGATELRQLWISRNRISDLLPLKGVPLQVLSCMGNPLRSLAPFEDSPQLELCLFDSVTAGERYMESLLRRWEARGDTANVRIIRSAIATRRGQYSRLRDLAAPFGGRRYLYLPQSYTIAEARELARLAGGHLLTVTSEAEYRFSLSLARSETGVWLGLEREGNADRWCTGEPVTFTDYASDNDAQSELPKHQLRSSGRPGRLWFAAMSADVVSPMIIEWER